MKNLIRIFLIVVIVGASISIGSSFGRKRLFAGGTPHDVLHIVHN